MPSAYYTGEGATANFPGISSACARSISVSGFSVDKIDATCLDSSNFKEYIPSFLKEPGEVSATFRFDGELPVASVGTVGTATITFGLLDGESTAASLTGSGFLTDVSTSEINGTSLVEMTVTFAFDGIGTEPAFTAGS
jgi:hypothetical protein